MKKTLFFVMLTSMLFIAVRSNANWEYCRYTTQVTSDSWNVYIRRTWTGSNNVARPATQYRYDTYDPFTQTYTTTAWANLPSNGFIGVTGLGGGISNIEIREVDANSIPMTIFRQFFVNNPC